MTIYSGLVWVLLLGHQFFPESSVICGAGEKLYQLDKPLLLKFIGLSNSDYNALIEVQPTAFFVRLLRHIPVHALLLFHSNCHDCNKVQQQNLHGYGLPIVVTMVMAKNIDPGKSQRCWCCLSSWANITSVQFCMMFMKSVVDRQAGKV